MYTYIICILPIVFFFIIIIFFLVIYFIHLISPLYFYINVLYKYNLSINYFYWNLTNYLFVYTACIHDVLFYTSFPLCFQLLNAAKLNRNWHIWIRRKYNNFTNFMIASNNYLMGAKNHWIYFVLFAIYTFLSGMFKFGFMYDWIVLSHWDLSQLKVIL